MMQSVAIGMAGKRLRYRDLIAGNGLPSGARGTMETIVRVG